LIANGCTTQKTSPWIEMASILAGARLPTTWRGPRPALSRYCRLALWQPPQGRRFRGSMAGLQGLRRPRGGPHWVAGVNERSMIVTSKIAETSEMRGSVAPIDHARAIRATTASCARTLLGTDVAPDAPLMAAGLDSIAATEFARVLSTETRAGVSEIALFDHPTLESIASHVLEVRVVCRGERMETRWRCCHARFDPDLTVSTSRETPIALVHFRLGAGPARSHSELC
jgi:hypothetical protein